MSSLFSELDIEVVKLSLMPKAGGAAVDYYFAQDYWPAGTIYPDSPACYPLLASSPVVKRGVDVFFRIDFDVSIEIFADSHLSEYGKTFYDLLQTHEVHNAYAEIRYYAKPVAEGMVVDSAALRRSVPLWGGIHGSLPIPDGTISAGDRAHMAFTYRGSFDSGSVGAALTTHTDADNIRQTLNVVDTSYDQGAGVITLRCGDVLFKDKEVTRRLDSTILTGLDEKWKGKYGAIVFGQSTVTGDGIAIDAPYFASGIDGSNRPNAKLFSGWTFDGHPNKALQRILVQNQFTDQNTDDWVEVSLETDPQTAGAGEVVGTPDADPPNWPRDLSRYSRAIVTEPAADAAKILTAVRSYAQANTSDRSASLIDGQYFFHPANPDFLSAGDTDLTIEMWVYLGLLHSGSANRIIARQGDLASNRLEWQIYFNTTNDKIRFGISGAGTAIDASVATTSSAILSNWIHLVFRHNESANEISIQANDGTPDVITTGAFEMQRLDGPFVIGSNISGEPGFEGRVKIFRYWTRLLTSVENTELYSSGVPVLHEALPDSFKVALRCAYDMNEPYGNREDSHGSSDLSEGSNNTSLSANIGYNISLKTIVPDNQHGDTVVTVSEAEMLAGGSTYNPIGSSLRQSTIDIATSAIQTGTANAYWQINPPLVMAPEVSYLTAVEFTNSRSNSYFVRGAYETNSGSTHQAKNKLGTASNWSEQVDVRFDMQHYYLGQGDDGWEDGTASGATRYSYQHAEAKSITLSDGQLHLTFPESLVFKIAVSGIADDGSGTYTGTANAVIEKPTDLILFTLLDDDFGLGIDSGDVDLTAFAAAKAVIAAQYPDGLKMQIVLESQVYAKDFIREIGRQARLVFYKTRDGKLSIKAPTLHTTFDAKFSEARDRETFDLLSVADRDYSQVINEFHQLYLRDPINQPPETDFKQLNPKDKLANELYITPDEASSGDTYYTGLATASQALYGRREHTAPFNFYDDDTWAQPVQNYYCARYSTLQRRATFRVPRRDWFADLDLFDAVQIQHTGLANENGTSLKVKTHDLGYPITAYYEGTPVLQWAGGSLDGQIVEIEEAGSWITYTIETVSPFK